jgi:hypothetical protein
MKSNVQVFIETNSLGRMELTERADSYSFGTLQPGGWWQAQVLILAPERDLWILADAEETGILTFVVNGDEVWRGDLAGTTLEKNHLTIRAQGAAMRLKGDEIWQAFADSEYGRWQPLDTERFDRDNNNRLYLAARASTEYGEGERCRIRWPEMPGELDGRVKRVSARVDMAAWGREWKVGLRAGNTDVWEQSFEGSASGVANVHITAVENRGVLDSEYVEILNTGSLEKVITDFMLYSDATLLYTFPPFTMPAGQSIKVYSKTGVNTATDLYMGLAVAAFVEASGLAILNNDAASLRAQYRWLDVDETVDAETIEFWMAPQQDGLAEAFVKVTRVTVRTLDSTMSEAIIDEILTANELSGTLQASGLEIDQLVSEGRSGIDVIRDVAYLGDGNQSWLFVIYEHGAEFKPWSTAPDWLVTRADLAMWSIQRDRENVFNAVRARLPDRWTSEWFEDAKSIARNFRREKTLNLPQTSQAEARRWAQIYLSEMANVLSSLRIEATSLVRKPDNSFWPAVMIRAGHVVALRDLIPQQDVIVRVSETTYNGSTLQIVPVGASSRLEVILARREAVSR